MADLRPLLITARNKDHAEYLVRSRAEQRGIGVSRIDATDAGNGMWSVDVVLAEGADATQAANLGDDTQTLHFDTHPSRPR